MNVKEKVADALLYLKQMFGVLEDSGVTIDAGLTRQDLADIAGINKEQISRVLAELKKEETLDIRGNKIFIFQLQKLNELTHSFR